MSDLRANRRGILALVAGMATFTVNDALVKFVARSYPFGEVIFVRGVMAVVLVGAILFGRGQVRKIENGIGGPLLWRSVFEAFGMTKNAASMPRVFVKMDETPSVAVLGQFHNNMPSTKPSVVACAISPPRSTLSSPKPPDLLR